MTVTLHVTVLLSYFTIYSKYISNTDVPSDSIGFHENIDELYMSKQTNSKMVSWEMKWVTGKCLTKPYQSFGLDVGLLTGYKEAHWLRNVPLNGLLVQQFS